MDPRHPRTNPVPVPPPPKGILKNRSRDESKFKDDWDDTTDTRRDNNSNGSYSGYGSHKVESSDRGLRQKLNEFISRKGELLFRPLGTDETPMKDEKGTHRTTQDHYGVVPAMDFFLSLDTSARKRHFFNTVHEGEILIASLTSRTVPGLHLKVLCLEGGRGLVLDDLGIDAFCPTNQMVPPIDPQNPNRIYANGDFVRCEILKITPDNERIVVGMKGNLLSPELLHSYQLGLIFEHDLPPDYTIAVRVRETREKKTYEELLEKSVGFRNPNNIVHLASSMGILNHESTLMAGLSGVFPAKDMAKELRKTQNGKWAHGSVAEGIRYFKSGNYTEAFQCLNKAISIDAENVEGLVARGALYANKASFEKAIKDFESALRFNPSHYNARKYLAETLCAFAKQQEGSGSLEDAVATYAKCLSVRPDHVAAKEALWAIYARMEKLDVALMSSAVATKTIELKEKLKVILHDDIIAVKEAAEAQSSKSDKSKKTKKERKSRKDSSDSESSSSSSESESDSNSDSDSRGKKKKKSRRKSKKSKRSKKDQVKEKEPSLSPFSKRLAEHGAAGMGYPGGSDLVGFNQSTYTEWGKRVGVVEVASEEDKKPKKDKKKSRRRSKDKHKRRKQDSDSSSQSDSSDGSLKRKPKRSKVQETSAVASAVIPDLGDLEAKLTAYYSKVEKEKVKAEKPANSASTSSHHESKSNDTHQRSHESHKRQPEVSTKMAPQGQGFTLGKIQLNTDQYGNFIHPENIVRTVVNETVQDTKPKFEMKFRSPGAPSAPTGTLPSQAEDSGLGSKWRKIGAPPARDENYVVTRLDGSAVVKNENDTLSKAPVATKPPVGIDHSISNPLESSDTMLKAKEEPRKYRSRKSLSRSRSRSRSPRRRRGRRSRSRSRSRSRASRGRRHSRSSDSRSRSRSRSPGYRSRRYLGRGNRRFFRGFRNDRGSRGSYRGGRGSYRPSYSRVRNVFRSGSRSRSRSRGRYSKSKSRSPRNRKDRSRSRNRDSKRDEHRRSNKERERKDDSKPEPGKEPEIVTIVDDEMGAEKAVTVPPDTNEFQVGSMTTTNAKDVENLLDQRNAQKKEEMRERNPDFFRAN